MSKDTLNSWFTKGNVAEAGKTSNQLEGVSRVARGIAHTVCSLRQLYEVMLHSSQDSGHINCIIEAKRDRVDNFALPVLENLKSFIDEKNSNIKSLTVMGFCYSIVEDGTLCKELEELKELKKTGGSLNKEEELKKLGGSLHKEFEKVKKDEHKNYQRFCCKLKKIIEDFKLEDLENKIRLLVFLKEEVDFANIQKAYDNWYFNDLIGNINFRQEYVNKAVEEREQPVRENIGNCIRLAEQGKQIASRHFEKTIAFQAYCEETGNANRTLNVNLINYDGNEPIRISDILRQEEDVDKLNIYCKSKCEVRAFRDENNKRHYRFEKGAYYQMTSKWPVKDESGRVTFTCIMVMDVSSEGITEAKFSGKKPNGESCELSLEKDKGLIKQNEELYIGNLSLCKAVEEFLGTQRNEEDVIRKGKDRGHNSAPPLHNVVSTDTGSRSSSSRNASTPAEDTIQRPVIHRKTDLQQQKIDESVQGNQELLNELYGVSSDLDGLMQNFEGLKDNAKRRNKLQDARTAKLEGKVEKLGKRVDKICGNIGDKRKIKSLESQVKKLWDLLPKDDQPYGYMFNNRGSFNICGSSESSSDEESEGYKSGTWTHF